MTVLLKYVLLSQMFCKANEKFKDTEVGGQRMKTFIMCI